MAKRRLLPVSSARHETTKATTELRSCTGSARFGIEPDEAPIADFPKQPSRMHGLGTMWTEHCTLPFGLWLTSKGQQSISPHPLHSRGEIEGL